MSSPLPSSNIANENIGDTIGAAGPVRNPDYTNITQNTTIPSQFTQGTEPPSIYSDKNLQPPLGSKAIKGPASSETISRNLTNLTSSLNRGRNNNMFTPRNLPFMNNDQLMAFHQTFNSPEMSDIIKASQSASLDAAGLTGDIPAAIRQFQTTQQTRAANRDRNQVKINNQIFEAQQQLMAAEEFFYRIIKTNCPTNTDNRICKNFKNLQQELLNDKIQKIILNNIEVQKKTTQEIVLYNEQTITLIRLKELLATRIEELSQLEEKLNNLTTSIRKNTRSNFYQAQNTNFAREIQLYLIFFYYQTLIFYLFISNFFPNQNYTKFLPVVLVVLYLIFPLILQHVVIFISELFSKIQQSLGIAPREKHLINKNI